MVAAESAQIVDDFVPTQLQSIGALHRSITTASRAVV
jgi:hypothetical protein